jgi:hypothetical protein
VPDIPVTRTRWVKILCTVYQGSRGALGTKRERVGPVQLEYTIDTFMNSGLSWGSYQFFGGPAA